MSAHNNGVEKKPQLPMEEFIAPPPYVFVQPQIVVAQPLPLALPQRRMVFLRAILAASATALLLMTIASIMDPLSVLMATSSVNEDSLCPIAFEEVDQKGVYLSNREKLVSKLSTASNQNDFIFIVGGKQLTRLGSDTDLSFRQDSDFLYLTGYDRADLHLAISLRAPFNSYLFYPPSTQSEVIFNGAPEEPYQIAEKYGFKDVLPTTSLMTQLAKLFPNATSVLTTDVSNLQVSLPEIGRKYKTSSGGVLSLLRSQRQDKTDRELDMIRIAARVSAAAHVQAMTAAGDVVRARGSWFENSAENVFTFVTKSCGLKMQAYMPIVGAGVHSGVLHYVNNDDVINRDSMILVDAAAEYFGYASDITRTYPASGKFTKEQRDVYEIVLAAQEAAIAALKPGVSLSSISQISKKTLIKGLREKGFVTGTQEELERVDIDRVFMPHGLSHGVGLDVHDPNSAILTARTVLTIEPGMYFIPVVLENTRRDAVRSRYINWAVVDKYSRFGGVRIEDVVIVGNGTVEVVSKDAPKSIADIEALMSL